MHLCILGRTAVVLQGVACFLQGFAAGVASVLCLCSAIAAPDLGFGREVPLPHSGGSGAGLDNSFQAVGSQNRWTPT